MLNCPGAANYLGIWYPAEDRRKPGNLNEIADRF